MRRNVLLTGSLLVLIMLFGACRKYLEKPVSSEVTIKEVFESKDKAEQFLWNVYSTCSIFEFPYFWDAGFNGYYHYGATYTILAAACDEADAYANYTGAEAFNKGNWGPTDIYWFEFRSEFCYKGIRNANIFIENIDRSPFTDTEKAAMKAEAVFLRALMHFDLMQRLGGVAIADKVLSVSGAADIPNVTIPRSTFEETVEFIVKSCDDAAKDLPNNYDSRFRGRITKGAALALKARTLLYAASPLFNSNDTYVPVGNPALRAMVGYADGYKVERWKRAADASKAVLDWARTESSGCALYMGKNNAVDRYEEIFINPNVSEIILDAGLMGLNSTNYFVRFMTPGTVVYTGTDPVNIGVTFNFAKFYQKADGTEQTWNETPGTAYPYAQYVQKLGELEPRFQASVFQSGTEWARGTGTRYHFYEQSARQLNLYNGVGFLRKFVKGVSNGSSPAPRWITFRLAEFYLNYAEALNESNGPSSEITAAVNEIRARVNMPPVAYTSQAEMREKIRRERAVELAFEQHRYFDVRRWKIAGQEGVMKGGMYSLKLYGGAAPTYKLEKFEDRAWSDKMYLYPFRVSEVELGYIVQNPGW
ncbi:RagB/SusD family nutrient uptake outer membrane protein [Chitinophaga lutea]|uniref:RagB/SusD family nutrient uptake outer membrane protein n=1 Tax=Chitinophaga lutea TaxID=2488634 RepID=A0A3N4Q211_9BACT|nr:RagB/SusD family nutrient uptake outer membrane protein [Chitinophaga lutea]RPE09990.1 RagB/SusD family nutrient uptake outer membrane protein [Chitinophaga lutea]